MKYNDNDIVVSEKIGIVSQYSAIKVYVSDEQLRLALEMELIHYGERRDSDGTDGNTTGGIVV